MHFILGAFKKTWAKVCEPFKEKDHKEDYGKHVGSEGNTWRKKEALQCRTMFVQKDPSFGYNPENKRFMSFPTPSLNTNGDGAWGWYCTPASFNEPDNNNALNIKDEENWDDARKDFVFDRFARSRYEVQRQWCWCLRRGGMRHLYAPGCQEEDF